MPVLKALLTPDIARNPALLTTAHALRAALFPIPVITIFWQEQIGMSLADIMILQAIFAVAIVALEFPSGYIADRLGYRLSLCLGAVFWVVGWTLYAVGTTFGAMVIAEVVLGAGFAFTSGADSALLYVSLKASDSVSQYTRWEGRVRAAAQVSEAVSSGLGGWLYSLSPRLPFWLQIPVALGGYGAVAATREIKSETSQERIPHLARAWHIVRHALVRNARLRSAMMLSVSLGISTYVAVWLIQPWMRRRGIPVAWFGPLWALAHLWLAGVSLMSARVAEALGISRSLLVCCALAGIAYLGLGLSMSGGGVIFYLGFMTVRGLQGPLLASVLQKDAPPEDRASVLSLNALLFRLVAAVVLPPIGMLADGWGLDFVLTALALMAGTFSLAAWALFARAHGGRS
ncbi:MAG: MFS transporter [Candidatus Binatia bacterium]